MPPLGNFRFPNRASRNIHGIDENVPFFDSLFAFPTPPVILCGCVCGGVEIRIDIYRKVYEM